MLLNLIDPALMNSIGAYLIMGVLTVVWGTMLWVAWQVVRIARSGKP